MKRPEIDRLLPAVFQSAADGGPLGALLDVMSLLHERSEADHDGLDRFFDPGRAPDAFLPFLGRMVHLQVEVSTGVDRLRVLIARAVALSQYRGTCQGLIDFLETATGVAGFRIDEPAGPAARPFHIRVSAPAALRDHADMLQRIIREEKPAFVTHELRFD